MVNKLDDPTFISNREESDSNIELDIVSTITTTIREDESIQKADTTLLKLEMDDDDIVLSQYPYHKIYPTGHFKRVTDSK